MGWRGYGAAIVSGPQLERRGHRKINVFSMAFSLFAPWALFCAVFGILSFSFRYNQPGLANVAVAVLLLPAIVSCVHAVREVMRMIQDGTGAATWSIFLFLTLLLAWGAGAWCGNVNFGVNMRPFYDVMNLNTYPQVDPSKFRGQQLMDAGRIVFTQNTKLDLRRSMGFKNVDMYCVAPITVGNENVSFKPLASYDFWAVGLNCCGDRGDFKCGEFNNPLAHAGLRVMNDDHRPFFRLAVQQAESAFNLKAVHPILLYYMQDPIAESQAYQDEGFKYYFLGMCGHLILQMVLVVLAATLFHALEKRADGQPAAAKTVLL